MPTIIGGETTLARQRVKPGYVPRVACHGGPSLGGPDRAAVDALRTRPYPAAPSRGEWCLFPRLPYRARDSYDGSRLRPTCIRAGTCARAARFRRPRRSADRLLLGGAPLLSARRTGARGVLGSRCRARGRICPAT